MRSISMGDLIVGRGNGALSGYHIPTALLLLPDSRLRLSGGVVVDIATHVGDFFIDDIGRKHIEQLDAGWQFLSCAWDDDLINDGGNWRVRTASDDLDDLRADRLADIRDSYDTVISAITSAYPQSEIDTWSTQEAEAIAYQADPAAAVPFLTSQALARGITVADLATLIVTKAATYKLAVGAALGKRQSLDEQIDAASSSAELEAIVW